MYRLLFYLTLASMLISASMVFIYAPQERVMGVIQKIFYFHVAAAWTGFLALFVVFAASVLFLFTKRVKYDRLAGASAELGVLFITIVLITGPIWGKAAWGTWWTWEPKLTTTLILWLIYVAYLILRKSAQNAVEAGNMSAIFGIIGFINIPLVYYAVDLWGRKLHPPAITGGGLPFEMLITLIITVASFSLLYMYLLRTVYEMTVINDRVIIHRRKILNLYRWE